MPTLHTVFANWWRIALIWLALDIVVLDVMWRLTDHKEEGNNEQRN